MSKINFVPFLKEDIKEIKLFLDKTAGINYLTENDLEEILENKVFYKGMNASFVAKDRGKVIAVRLTYAPTKWIIDDQGKTYNKWKVEKDKVAKFHCLYIDDSYRGKGIGPKLSKMSVDVLKKMGAEAILCYSWLESFNNSSQRYLKKYGFESVAIHKDFWADLDYICSGCKKQPCDCTAEEMIFYIND